MTCREFQERIEDLALGDVEPSEADALRAHAAACPSCAARLEEAEALDARLRGLRARYSTPPLLEEKVRAALRGAPGESGAGSPSNIAATPRWLRLWRWAPAAAAALLVAAVAVLFLAGPGPAVPPVVADTFAAYDGLSSGGLALDIASGNVHDIQAYFGTESPTVPPPRCCDRCTCPPDECTCRLKGGCRCAMPLSGVQASCVVYDHEGTSIAMLHVGPARLGPGALASAERIERGGHTVYRFQRNGVNVAVCPACDPSRLWVSRLGAETLVAAAHGMMYKAPREQRR